jgi:hypothetical protein
MQAIILGKLYKAVKFLMGKKNKNHPLFWNIEHVPAYYVAFDAMLKNEIRLDVN